MGSRQGITESQARRLLELAQKHNKICYIKVFNKHVRSHPNNGVLKAVINSEKALVRPFRHGHDEEEPLSNIFLWKKGCDFDISEVANMNSKPFGERISIPHSVIPTGGQSGIQVGPYVIFSAKMKSVWAGSDRRWVQNFSAAHRWMDHGDGQRAIGKINKIPLQDDAVLLPIAEAHQKLTEVLRDSGVAQRPSAPSAHLPFKPPVANLPSRTVTQPSSTLLMSAKPRPAPPVELEEDDFIDIDVLRGKDNTSLKIAEDERLQASENYATAKRVLSDVHLRFKKELEEAEANLVRMKAKFAELDQRVASLGGSSALKEHKKKAAQSTGKRQRIKPFILNIMLNHSRLDLASIHEKIAVDFPEIDRNKISKALSNYKDADLVERSDSGGWALTAKGREKALKKADSDSEGED